MAQIGKAKSEEEVRAIMQAAGVSQTAAPKEMTNWPAWTDAGVFPGRLIVRQLEQVITEAGSTLEPAEVKLLNTLLKQAQFALMNAKDLVSGLPENRQAFDQVFPNVWQSIYSLLLRSGKAFQLPVGYLQGAQGTPSSSIVLMELQKGTVGASAFHLRSFNQQSKQWDTRRMMPAELEQVALFNQLPKANGLDKWVERTLIHTPKS